MRVYLQPNFQENDFFFENIILSIQLYNKNYHQKLNHFQETKS